MNWNTEIRIGDSPIVSSNALCANVHLSGVFNCSPNPLIGTNLGLRKNDTTAAKYAWLEIRAYEHPPMALYTSMMSSNEVGNTSLANALSFTMIKGSTTTSNTEALKNNSYFNTGTNGAGCFLKIDFGAVTNVKVVLVVGIPDLNGSVNWKLRLGN